MRSRYVLVLLLGLAQAGTAITFRELRHMLPKDIKETGHFIVMCDDPEMMTKVCAFVEKAGSRLWGEVSKGVAKPWETKPIVAVCGRKSDADTAAGVTRQADRLNAPSLQYEGNSHRCCFVYVADPKLFTDALPSLLALHTVEGVFRAGDKTPYWFKAGLYLRERSQEADKARRRFREAAKRGEQLPLSDVVKAGATSHGTLGSLFAPQAMVFLDFFLGSVPAKNHAAFLEATRKGGNPAACLAKAFSGRFRSWSEMEKAFLDYARSI